MVESLPCISIIILTYNRKQYLQNCIKNLINQDLPKHCYNIWVIDDGSNDGTKEMVSSLCTTDMHIFYFHQQNKGIPAARNKGLELTKTKYIAFVADDYIIPKDYVSTILQFFQKYQDARIIRFPIGRKKSNFIHQISHFYFEVSHKSRLLIKDNTFCQIQLLKDEEITTQHSLDASGGAAFHKEIFDIVGAFDESLKRAEDTDLTWRLKEKKIFVHYYPFLKIQHHYPANLWKTIKQCFATGYYRFFLLEKYKNKKSISNTFTQKSHSFHVALSLAKQIDKKIVFFAFFFAAIFEISNKIGYMTSYCNNAFKKLR